MQQRFMALFIVSGSDGLGCFKLKVKNKTRAKYGKVYCQHPGGLLMSLASIMYAGPCRFLPPPMEAGDSSTTHVEFYLSCKPSTRIILLEVFSIY